MNARLLKAKMILYGDENFSECLANILDITRQTASSKLNGTTPFTQPEISTIAKHYQMTGDELREIFVEGESSDGERSSEASR